MLKTTTRFAAISLMAFVASACSSPTAPSLPTGQPTPASAQRLADGIATIQSVNTPSTTPTGIAFEVDGRGTECAEAGGQYNWHLMVTDSGPTRMHVVTYAAHAPEPGCAATEPGKGGHDWFNVYGRDSYFPHESGGLSMFYDPGKVQCGRVQLDASFKDDNGKEFNFFAAVIDYGKACVEEPSAPTPPPVTPEPPVTPPITPVPPIQPVPPQPECPGGAAAVLLKPIGQNITHTDTQAYATFTIAPGCANIEVSLVSYQKQPPDFAFLPQAYIDGTGGVFSAGEHTLGVNLAPCSPQADLYLGGYEPGVGLDWGNWESNYNPRTLDWIYSNEACR